MNDIHALRKETSESFLTPPSFEDRSRRWPSMNEGAGAPQSQSLLFILILNFQVSRTIRDKR